MILCGDCREELSKLPRDHFGVCFTSPPYNVGKDYGPGYDDSIPCTEYLDFIHGCFDDLYPVMRHDALLFVNIGNNRESVFKAHDVAWAVQQAGFLPVQEIIWVKSISVPLNGEVTSVGHYTPVGGSRRLNPLFEYVFLFSKTEDYELDRLSIGVPYQDKGNIGRYADQDRRCRGNVWLAPYPTTGGVRKKGHPAPFPLELAMMGIKLSRGPVIDPFAGILTTGKAAELLDREYCCIEQNEEFIETGKALWGFKTPR